MNIEIELKYDVSLKVDENEILRGLEDIFITEGYLVSMRKCVTRTFQYYDTLDLQVYHKGETIRRVGGFDILKDKWLYRYDFKIGPVDDRYEHNHWSNETLDPQEILQTFKLEKYYDQIKKVADVNTRHTQIRFVKEKIQIEATLDEFILEEGKVFKELELELKEGEVERLQNIGEKVLEQMFYLQRIKKQKYARVIDMMKENYEKM